MNNNNLKEVGCNPTTEIVGFLADGLISTSGTVETTTNGFDWLNAHHFDYRDLIPIGLALPATEGMYNN